MAPGEPNKAPEVPQGGGVARIEKKTNLAPIAQEMLYDVLGTWAYQEFIVSVAPEANRLESGQGTEADKTKVLNAIDDQLASAHNNFPNGEDSASSVFLKLRKHYEDMETVNEKTTP